MLSEVFRRRGDDPLADQLDTEACVQLLQEFAGACLLGFAASYAVCLVLVGPGNDGKSKVLAVLRGLFPERSICAVPPQSWSRGFLLAELAGRRLNVVTELPERDIMDSERFKAVVAGDPMTAERKFGDPFQLVPLAGHLFAANDLPGTRDQSKGFWRRFAVIPCTRQFQPDEEVKNYDRLVLAEELAGVAGWAVEGAARLQRQGRYTQPVSATQAKLDWQLDSDQVRQFVDDCARLDEGAETPIDELYEAFVEWCRKTGHVGMNRNRFGARLRSLGYWRRTKIARFYVLRLLPGVRADSISKPSPGTAPRRWMS